MGTWTIVVDSQDFDSLMTFIPHNGLIIAEKMPILPRKWSSWYFVLVSRRLHMPTEYWCLNLHVAAVSVVQDVSRGVSLAGY